MILDSGKWFWILGLVLDSGVCFWIMGSVLESGKRFVLTSHRNILFLPTIKVFTRFQVINAFKR